MKTRPMTHVTSRHSIPARRTCFGLRTPVTSSGERVSFSTVSVPFEKSPYVFRRFEADCRSMPPTRTRASSTHSRTPNAWWW